MKDFLYFFYQYKDLKFNIISYITFYIQFFSSINEFCCKCILSYVLVYKKIQKICITHRISNSDTISNCSRFIMSIVSTLKP